VDRYDIIPDVYIGQYLVIADDVTAAAAGDSDIHVA
jgi:hypothetical protein